ncbi:MAG: hypothetical protein KGZ54_00610 [Dethiobacter sp.]|nr:hypothetical protein [Dethiobacter sp.]MBS3990042.1 hypothetical protein [Dethiobacter sp.]
MAIKDEIKEESALEEMMLNSVSALLKLIVARTFPVSDGSRFWAQVMQSHGDSALLESAGEKFSAKLETAVSPGEKLLLEQLFTRDGKLHCKVLHRLPATEAGTLPANSFYMFWDQREAQRASYLLTAATEEKRAGCAGADQLWRFILYTENLGAVTILAGNKQGRAECSILVENVAAATKLAHLIEMFSDTESSGPLLRGIRVSQQGENSKTGCTGGCLDHTR